MKIKRNQVNEDEDVFKQVHLKVDREDGSLFERNTLEAFMYPNYDVQIRLKIPGLGFTLYREDAILFHALLTAALKEFKD